MNKNNMYSAMLSLLLLVPGQAWCSEQPVSQGILDRLMIPRPAALSWMSNFSTNVASSFSALPDKAKYVIYGTMAALLGYVWYKVVSFPSKEAESQAATAKLLYNANFDALDNKDNILNVKLLLAKTPMTAEGFHESYHGNRGKFETLVCPVLSRFSKNLETKEAWSTFLPKLAISPVEKQYYEIEAFDGMQMGYRLYQMMRITCPNSEIMNPLKELLIEKNPKDTQLLKILNQ